MKKTSPKKVLIVDDDFDIRLALAELLIGEGYKVATARDGQAGLCYLENEQELPCLVLLDMKMPVLNGYQFRNIQKNTKDISEVPVVFMSAEPKKLEKIDGQFLEKPFDLINVIKTVEKYSKKTVY